MGHVAVAVQHTGRMCLGVVRPDAPDRHGRRIVFLLLGHGRVEAGNDVIERRVLRLLPQVPMPALDDTAILWGRELLELARCGILSHDLLVALDHVPRESPRKEQLTLAGAWILPAEECRVGALGVILHRDHDVVITELLLKDHAGHVFFVQALHDHDDCGLVRVVQAGRDRLLERLDRGRPLGFGGGRGYRVRVVDDHAVATSTRHTRHGYSLAKAGRRRLVLDLLVLVACDRNPIAPPFLIPFGCDKSSHLGAVSDGKRHGMRGAHVPHIGHVARSPFPSRP